MWPNAVFGLNDAVWPEPQIHVSIRVLAVDEMQCYDVTKPEPLLFFSLLQNYFNNLDSGFVFYTANCGTVVA